MIATPEEHARRRRWAIIAAIITVAACVLAGFMAVGYSEPSHTAVYGVGRHGWRLPNDHITPGKTVPGMTREKVCQISWEDDDDDGVIYTRLPLDRRIPGGRGVVFLAGQSDQPWRWHINQRGPGAAGAARKAFSPSWWSSRPSISDQTELAAVSLLVSWRLNGGRNDDVAVLTDVGQSPESDQGRPTRMALSAWPKLAVKRDSRLQERPSVRRDQSIPRELEAAAISAARLSHMRQQTAESVERSPTSWSRDARHVTLSMKHEVCQRYGARACPGPHWEIDHRISRELGGADDVENLWPQPITEARKKDTLENFLHRAVCTEAITLERAQEILRDDWTKYYDKMHGEGHGLTFGKPFGQ